MIGQRTPTRNTVKLLNITKVQVSESTPVSIHILYSFPLHNIFSVIIPDGHLYYKGEINNGRNQYL